MQAATKYIGGHSDIMFGTISANPTAWPLIAETIRLLGVCAGPDDVFLALRGLRTLAVRLAQHQQSALEMARWLASRPEVIRVLHPGAGKRPGPRDLEAGFYRRVRPVQHRSEAGAAESGRCLARRRPVVRHGLFMGRFREPCHSVRLRRLPHRHHMGAGRADACGSISGSRMSGISRPIWSAALRPSTPHRLAAERAG